ncbi:hypothetical protein J6590_020232 [Homalodisca vitripennis]|nr:hypothetical protein J6590_020232 [Homalodisca vitripennis]
MYIFTIRFRLITHCTMVHGVATGLWRPSPHVPLTSPRHPFTPRLGLALQNHCKIRPHPCKYHPSHSCAHSNVHSPCFRCTRRHRKQNVDRKGREKGTIFMSKERRQAGEGECRSLRIRLAGVCEDECENNLLLARRS